MATPFSPRGPSGWFPHFNDTMGRSDSPPSVSTRSNSSRADTIVSPVVCSPRSWASHRGPGSCRFRSPIRIDDGNVGVSQVPWKPWWSLSVLFDPGRTRQAEWTMSELPGTAPACVHDEGSRRLVLSGLNHTAFDLAVYASQDWPPHHHARLASGCWSGFTGRDLYPQGSSERFQSSSLFLLVCLFPASLAYWRQRREECCNPPEALTSLERLLPPARCARLWYIMRPGPLITRITLPEILRGRLTPGNERLRLTHPGAI